MVATREALWLFWVRYGAPEGLLLCLIGEFRSLLIVSYDVQLSFPRRRLTLSVLQLTPRMAG